MCKHGTRAKTKKRDNSGPNQHTYHTQCQFGARLKFDFDSEELYFATVNSTQHNHPVSEEIFNNIKRNDQFNANQDSIQMANTFLKTRAPISDVVTAINDEYKLKLNRQDILNFKHNEINAHHQGKDQADLLWSELCKLIAKDSTSVKTRVNDKGEIEAFFIQTAYMKNWYKLFADIHHIDSTFKINLENFQLYISLVHNGHGNGVPTGYMFMKSAFDENL
jgi:hypothetical protein